MYAFPCLCQLLVRSNNLDIWKISWPMAGRNSTMSGCSGAALKQLASKVTCDAHLVSSFD